MTYLADWGSRGPLIFGLVMGVGWFAICTVAKLIREGTNSGHRTAVAISQNWFPIAAAAILGFAAVLAIVAILANSGALALTTLVVAVPFAVYALLRNSR
jgi:hypothetical protein